MQTDIFTSQQVSAEELAELDDAAYKVNKGNGSGEEGKKAPPAEVNTTTVTAPYPYIYFTAVLP